MVWEIMGEEDEQMFITGMLLLFDFQDYTMGHFTQMPLSMIKKLMPCWQVLSCERFKVQKLGVKNFFSFLGCFPYSS